MNNPKFSPQYFRPNEFGNYVFSKIQKDYKGKLGIFKKDDKDDAYDGSNAFGLFAVDERAREGNRRVMLPSESELLIKLQRTSEKGPYMDLGVVMDFSGYNHGLALHLYDMLQKEHRDLDLFPAILTGLVTRLDDSQDHGLSLETGGKYPYGFTTAKILSEKSGNFSRNNPNLVREGVPSKLGKGKRALYTTPQYRPVTEHLGLTRFTLGRDLILHSDVAFLASSTFEGRIVLMEDE